MNIFDRIINDQSKPETTLGNPLQEPMSIARRLNFFSAIRNGNGFRIPKKSVAKDAQGRTRGKRKRIRHALAFCVSL